MKIYKFFDWSLTDDESGLDEEAYQKLIKFCCDICEVVSFVIIEPSICSKKIQESLGKFSIPHPQNITYKFHYYDINGEWLGFSPVYYYRVCPELCQLLLNSATGIFDWVGYTYPEDPTFYRSDGSVFFTSTTHEGILTLMPRENEDVSDIISCENWLEKVI